MTPVIEYLKLAPVLAVGIGALVGVLAEAVVPRAYRFLVQVCLAVATLAVALALTIGEWTHLEHVKGFQIGAEGAVALDRTSYAVWTLLLVLGLGAVALAGERLAGQGASSFAASGVATPGSADEREALAARSEHSEVFPLMLFSMAGMLIFPAASDLVTAFVALEILSLPLYLLCGLARRRRLLSQEAALKYFLLGALSSAIFLYGIALLYAYAGSFSYRGIAAALSPAASQDVVSAAGPIAAGPDALLYAGIALVGVGLLFKVGAVPFHSWVPDVYTGAPTPVTAFMAVCTKVAAVFALIRIFFVALGGMVWTWQLPLAVVAVASMVVGAVFGLTQTNVKRLLAYSSIAHAGFVLVGVVPAATTALAAPLVGGLDSVGATWFYLAAYGLATLGAFAVVMAVRTSAGEEPGFDAWAGFGRRHPVAGAAMTVFLLSLAGIPLTGGFMGKLFAFTLAWRGGFAWLVVVALAFSVVTAGFYVKLLWTMFWGTPTGDVQPVRASVGLWVVIGLCVVGTIFLGVYPGPLTHLAEVASGMLR